MSADPTGLRDNRLGLPHVVHVAWCRACGLGVTIDPPSRSELAQLYASTYAPTGTAGRVPRAGRLARAWHAVNGSLPLSDLPLAAPVLDVGSHTGELLAALSARGIEAVGVEPNRHAAAIARRAGLEVIEAPLEEAPIEPGRFRTVVLSQVLEHSADPEVLLEAAIRALGPGGTIWVVVPNARSGWRRLFGRHWVHWHVPFHLFHFTERSLELLATRSGLSVRSVRNVTPGEWILMSLQARRNATRGRYALVDFEGRYLRRALLAPVARLLDALHRGDALVVELEPA